MAEGGDKFKKEFENQYKDLLKSARKHKNKNEEVSRAYMEKADELKQRYEAKSPKLMKDLEEWHNIQKLQEHVYALYPYGPKPK